MKLGKRNVMMGGGIILLLVMVLGIGIWYTNKQHHKKEVLASIDLVFHEDAYIEYGQEEIDFTTYIQEIKGEPEVTLPDVELDTKVLGKQELFYKLSKDGYEKEITITIEIKDTKAPEIICKEEHIELTVGDAFDPEANIESVKDTVDGDIQRSDDEKIEKNGYLINSEVDTATIGEYQVIITAYDVNGNKSEKEYLVSVHKKREEPKKPSYTGGTGTTSGSTNNEMTPNGGTSSNQSSSVPTKPEEPHYRTDISSSYAAQINAYREQNGLDALPITGEAQAEADMRAMQLVSSYEHNSSYGFGENIGMGGAGYDFFQAWKASPGHNANMVRDMYTAFAVSVVEYNGTWYAVTSFRTNY